MRGFTREFESELRSFLREPSSGIQGSIEPSGPSMRCGDLLQRCIDRRQITQVICPEHLEHLLLRTAGFGQGGEREPLATN